MAPTEILAQQHFKLMKNLSSKIGLRVEILTGSLNKSKRIPLLNDLKLGNVDILIGTHTLIEDPVVAAEKGVMLSPTSAFLVKTTASKGARISDCAKSALLISNAASDALNEAVALAILAKLSS